MADLEDRLRDALRARARAVEPDPRAWQRVESRIRRHRVMVWAAPATAVAAVAAIAVLAVPGLLPGQDDGVEFVPADDPTPEPEQPETETESEDVETLVDGAVLPVPALEGRVGGIAWADGTVRVVQTPEGHEIGHGPVGPSAGLAVAPGSDPEQFALASVAVGSDGSCRGGADYHVRADGSHFSSDSVGDCASAPRFSPKGGHVARVVRGDAQAIDIRAFGTRGPGDESVATAEIEGAEGDVEVVAWLMGPDDAEVLYLLDHGADRAGLTPVTVGTSEDSGSGLGLPSEIALDEEPEMATGEWRVEAAAARSASAPRAHGLALVQSQGDEVRLWAQGYEEEEPVTVPLPAELAGTDGRAWVFAEGDDVLVGDGDRAVWHVALDREEPAAQRLDVEWMTAALLPSEPGDPGDPGDPDDDDPPEPEDGDDGDAVTAYFVREEGNRQWVEPVRVPLHAPTVGVARAAMEALTVAPDGELETLLPEGTRILGVSINDGVLSLDVSGHLAEGSGGAGAESLLAQQLAHTATQFDGVDSLRLLVDGAQVSELWGHLDWSEPIEASDGALAPVVISEATATEGQIVVSGEATVYEATVELTLVGPDGDVVEETFETASCGGPCRGEWSHTFESSDLRSGTWRVIAAEPHVTDEGPAPFETAVEVEVP